MDSTSVSSTAKIALALAPAFIAGFAVQQAVEIASSWLSLEKKLDENVKLKKALLSGLSVVIAAFIITCSNLNVLSPFPTITPGRASLPSSTLCLSAPAPRASTRC